MDNQQYSSQSVKAEQTRLLYEALPLAFIATIVNACIIVVIEWPVIDAYILLSWLVAVFILTLYRFVKYNLYIRYGKQSEYNEAWTRQFNVGVILSAIVWGYAGVFLFPEADFAYQAFLVLVLSGMSAGAVGTLSYMRKPILIFLYAVGIPVITRLFFEGTPMAIAMGVMIVLYIIILTTATERIYQSTYQNIMLRIEAANREKALRDSEEKYRMIFESAPLGIMHYDSNGQIIDSNTTLAQLLGIERHALVGRNILDKIDDEELIAAFDASIQGKQGIYKGSTYEFIPINHIPVRMHCRGIKTSEGAKISGVAILEDITEETRIDKLKNEFVSTISHELRTPLTAIHGSLGMLAIPQTQLEKQQYDNLIDIAKRNSERLLLLINDILDIDKITSGNMPFHFDTLAVKSLLEQALTDNKTYGEKYQVRFTNIGSAEHYVFVDKDRFLQVMANLMSNAAKFSPAGSEIEIGVINKSDRLRLYVSDRGPGVAEEFVDSLFLRFSQYDSSDARQTGGTGLGLYISKEIIERMDGHIGYERNEHGGSTFYFELPSVCPA